MGRDRDPFERTIETLRRRLAAAGPQPGAPLAINLLAIELGVSQTPVREALAWLAGEGLIARGDQGYVGATYDAEGLAQRYELAMILVLAACRRRFAPAGAHAGQGAADVLETVVREGANPVLGEAFAHVRAQLAPLARAEAAVLGEADAEDRRLGEALALGPAAFARAVKRYYGRRAGRSGEILGRGLLERTRI